MNFKNYLSMAVLSLVTSNCMAFEIQKGKLIEHKEWTTGNAKGSFIYLPSSQQKTNHGMSLTNFKIFSAKGTVGTPTTIKGNNQFWYENDTDKTQEYYYSLSTCASVSVNTIHCIHISDKFTLEPGGSFNQNVSPEVKVIFDAPGSYTIDSAGYFSINQQPGIQNIASSTAEIS